MTTPEIKPQDTSTKTDHQDIPKYEKPSKTWHGHKLVRTKKFYDAEAFFGLVKK
jgi:hypothetical protein